MYIATVPNRKSPPAILLRESYREGGKVKNRTLANLSHLPPEAIEAVKRSLQGQTLVPAGEAFDIVRSRHHGQIQAVHTAIKRLGLEKLIAARQCPERDRVVAMLIARVVKPQTKLATTRWWHTTTLPEMLGVVEADEDDLYEAMDWLLERQQRIEKKLAARHLQEGGLALYDLSSSYFEGTTCPLAKRGHNRDGKKGKLQVNYGLLTDGRGCPVAVSVFEGNTADGKTLIPQIDALQQRFSIQSLTLVGDRGMISQKLIDATLREREGMDWITALKNTSIEKLIKSDSLQLELFDEKNLFELTHSDYPKERLIACRNPELAKRRDRKRQSLLEATAQALEKCRRTIRGGRLGGADKIRTRCGQLVSKELFDNFIFDIADDHFHFEIKDKQTVQEKAYLDTLKKLNQISANVDKGQLTGKAAIHRALEKVLSKKWMDHFELTVSDNTFSFQVIDESQAQQAAFESLTERLEELARKVNQGKYGGKDKIGLRIGKVVGKYKMEKHFVITITDNDFFYELNAEAVAAEAALDGIYILRTSVDKERLSADDTVRTYKSLSQVERAFRSFKSMDLHIRPIHHRLDNRVRAHIFICMLSYYVQWHMMEVWKPLLFNDEDQEAKRTRDPVAPAKRSSAAEQKAHTRRLDDGTCVHSFQTLLQELSTLVSNSCRAFTGEDKTGSIFEVTTTPNAKQQQALALLEAINP